MADSDHALAADEPPLLGATCELASTMPTMLAGLPRKVAGLIVFLCLSVIVWLESMVEAAGVVVGGVIVWFAVRELVADDLWGFDVLIAWFLTSFRFLDSGRREWGGARFAALPLRNRAPFGVSNRGPT